MNLTIKSADIFKVLEHVNNANGLIPYVRDHDFETNQELHDDALNNAKEYLDDAKKIIQRMCEESIMPHNDKEVAEEDTKSNKAPFSIDCFLKNRRG